MTTPAIDQNGFKEEFGSRELNYDRHGVTGRCIFTGPWENLALFLEKTIPLGSQFPDYDAKQKPVKLVHVHVVPFARSTDGTQGRAATHARIEADYSTEILSGLEPELNITFGVDISNTVEGRKWKFAKVTISDPIPVPIPTLDIDFTVILDKNPLKDILAMGGKVNSKVAMGCQKETLLLQGVTLNQEYVDQSLTTHWRCSYHFLWKRVDTDKNGVEKGHNWLWRKPVQARKTDGSLMYYQTTDGEPGTDEHFSYTEDKYKVGTPVYQHEIFGTGVPDWDYPLPPIYQSADFNLLPTGNQGPLGSTK